VRIRDGGGADSLALAHDSSQLLGTPALNRRPPLVESDPFTTHIVKTVRRDAGGHVLSLRSSNVLSCTIFANHRAAALRPRGLDGPRPPLRRARVRPLHTSGESRTAEVRPSATISSDGPCGVRLLCTGPLWPPCGTLPYLPGSSQFVSPGVSGSFSCHMSARPVGLRGDTRVIHDTRCKNLSQRAHVVGRRAARPSTSRTRPSR
jgi:hypothetical protein